jgi:colanic acid/amylovoran biosynthesis glycosyltransferase
MKQNKLAVIHSFPIWLPQTQTWMYNQAKYLPDTVDVHIVCERTENLEQFAVPNIHSLRNESLFSFYWQRGLRKLGIQNHLDFVTSTARKINAQLLHSHFGYVGWRNLEVVRQTDMRHIVTFYGEDVNLFPVRDSRWRTRYQRLFKQADLFLCEGPHMASCLMELGCPRDKIEVHHLGIAIEDIPYRPRQWHPGEPFRVLIAASFREKKGLPYAIAALGMLKTEADLEVTMIGDAGPDKSSQKEKQLILEAIAQHKLSTHVKLLGFQSYALLLEEAHKCHVFVSPSVTASNGDTEGGAPVVLIEMMASGLPVVSTSHCDIPSVVQYEQDGWLVAERDIDGLANRIRWLIDHPNDWRIMLDSGRKHVETDFDARQQGNHLAQIYKNVIAWDGGST